MMTCAVVGAIAAGVIAAYPLALLFPRGLALAAAAGALPVLLLRVPEVFEFWGRDEAVVYMSTIESVTLLAAVVTAAWMARKLMRAIKPSVVDA